MLPQNSPQTSTSSREWVYELYDNGLQYHGTRSYRNLHISLRKIVYAMVEEIKYQVEWIGVDCAERNQ